MPWCAQPIPGCIWPRAGDETAPRELTSVPVSLPKCPPSVWCVEARSSPTGPSPCPVDHRALRYATRMSLMREIRDYRVPRNAVAVWWLGQNGFLFKSPEGTLVSTDLYLTNSCAEFFRDSGINLER